MANDHAESRQLIIPDLAGLYASLSPYSYALMRFSVGAVLVPHGLRNLFYGGLGGTADVIAGGASLPAPAVWAFLAAVVQLLGGAFLALGLLTRPAAVVVWVHMTVSITVAHWAGGYFWTNGGIEYSLLSWLLCIAILFKGGGRYSLDRLIGKEV
jgi:putative oxidoreductase